MMRVLQLELAGSLLLLLQGSLMLQGSVAGVSVMGFSCLGSGGVVAPPAGGLGASSRGGWGVWWLFAVGLDSGDDGAL